MLWKKDKLLFMLFPTFPLFKFSKDFYCRLVKTWVCFGKALILSLYFPENDIILKLKSVTRYLIPFKKTTQS